jgi:hypothetical protein
MKTQYFSIGFLTEDYELEIMATISNGSGIMSDSDFELLLESTLKVCKSLAPEKNVVAIQRQDTSDSVVLDDDELEKYFGITEI